MGFWHCIWSQTQEETRWTCQTKPLVLVWVHKLLFEEDRHIQGELCLRILEAASCRLFQPNPHVRMRSLHLVVSCRIGWKHRSEEWSLLLLFLRLDCKSPESRPLLAAHFLLPLTENEASVVYHQHWALLCEPSLILSVLLLKEVEQGFTFQFHDKFLFLPPLNRSTLDDLKLQRLFLEVEEDLWLWTEHSVGLVSSHQLCLWSSSCEHLRAKDQELQLLERHVDHLLILSCFQKMMNAVVQ